MRDTVHVARTVYQPTWAGPAIDDERKMLDPKLHLMDMLEECGPMSIGELLGNVVATVEFHTNEDGDDVIDFVHNPYDLQYALMVLYAEGKVDYVELIVDERGDEYESIIDIIGPIQRDMPPIRMVELFAGIGAFRKALTNLGVPHTSIMSEIDKFAVESYNAIHGQTENLGDITKITELPHCDVLTYGFPCQDLSHAGLKKGMVEGSGTRSSLLWEVKRLLEAYTVKPKVLIMENVAGLISKTNRPHFDRFLDFLTGLGYTTTWKRMDPPDYGVPQHRPRIFAVSVLGDKPFTFPEPTCTRKVTLAEVLDHVQVPQDPEGKLNKEGIRRLTQREVAKLMGFSTRDAYRMGDVCSLTQIYKQFGNSIVVNIPMAIFDKLIADGFLGGGGTTSNCEECIHYSGKHVDSWGNEEWICNHPESDSLDCSQSDVCPGCEGEKI